MNSEIKDYISIVKSEFTEEENFIEQIASSDPKVLSELISRMDESQIDEITNMLFGDSFLIEKTIPAQTKKGWSGRQAAKNVWSAALKGATNLVTGRTLAKLKGLSARISNVNDIMRQWSKYKGEFGIKGDTGKDLYRFYQTTFPGISDETLAKSFKAANVNQNGNKDIDDIGKLITAVARITGEEASSKITSGELTDSDATSATVSKQKNTQSSQPQNQKITQRTQETPQQQKNNSTSVEELAYNDLQTKQNMSRRDIAQAVKTLSKVKNTADISKNANVMKLLATIGYYTIKR